jgi:hypothetical protein
MRVLMAVLLFSIGACAHINLSFHQLRQIYWLSS